MANMNEVPNIDQPANKAKRFGIKSLSDAELIALILGVGSKDNKMLKIANEMVSDSLTVFNMASMPYQYFLKFKGISSYKALKLCATFELAKRYDRHERILLEQNHGVNPETLYKRFIGKVHKLGREIMILVVLNRRKKVIYETTLYKGTENNIPLSIQEVFNEIILHHGHYFYLIHNHPNDFIEPSEEDLIFTEEVMRQSKKFNFVLLDHLIIGDSGYYALVSNCKKIY